MYEGFLNYVVHLLMTDDSSLDDVPEYITYSGFRRFK